MKEKNIMKKSFSLSASVIRKNRISFCIWLMEILLLFILSAFFVPTVDDLIFRFSFEYHSVREFFHYVIYYGNGRLLGNAFVLFFSRHTALFYALQTILFAVFSVVLEKCVALPYSRHYVFLYFIFQPLPVWNSTFSWMSSFINYYFPLILLAVVLLLLKKYFQAQIKHVNLWLPALFFAGVAMQLFNELNAAVNILVAFLLCLLFKRRKRKMLAPVLLFVSNLVGLQGPCSLQNVLILQKRFPIRTHLGRIRFPIKTIGKRFSALRRANTFACCFIISSFRFFCLARLFCFIFPFWHLCFMLHAKRSSIP